MRPKSYILQLFLAAVLFFIAPLVLGREVLQDERCVVEADEVVEGTLFVLCRELRIEGMVQGDVVGFAVQTWIEGEVQGSVYLLSGTLDLQGLVSQDVHYAGLVLQVGTALDDELAAEAVTTGEILGGIKSTAFSVSVHEPGRVQEGILAFGYQLEVSGTALDEINFWGAALQIAGRVEGDVYATVGDPESDSGQIETLLLPLNLDVDVFNPGLFIAEPATITGALQYSAPSAGRIDGDVGGLLMFEPTTPISLQTLDEPEAPERYFNQSLREFGTLLLIGALALFAMPQWVRPPLRTMRYRFFTSVSLGLLAFIISFPIVLIVLLLSITLLFIAQLFGLTNLGVALALVLAVVDIGAVGIFYFVAIYVGRAFVGLALGRLILYVVLRGNRTIRFHDYLSLIVGVLLLSLLIALPAIGWIVNAGALFLGLGAILLLVLDQFRRIRDSEVTLAPGWVARSPMSSFQRGMRPRQEALPVPQGDAMTPELPLAPPPPPDMDSPGTQPPPGMRNLPEGFDFSFFDEPPADDH